MNWHWTSTQVKTHSNMQTCLSTKCFSFGWVLKNSHPKNQQGEPIPRQPVALRCPHSSSSTTPRNTHHLDAARCGLRTQACTQGTPVLRTPVPIRRARQDSQPLVIGPDVRARDHQILSPCVWKTGGGSEATSEGVLRSWGQRPEKGPTHHGQSHVCTPMEATVEVTSPARLLVSTVVLLT